MLAGTEWKRSPPANTGGSQTAGRTRTELWRKLRPSILFQMIINNLEKKISRIFVTFTKDIKMEKVVILNKDISANATIKIL